MTKKYYTWDEVNAMPLGTKFRLPWWLPEAYVYFSRDAKGFLYLLPGNDYALLISLDIELMWQDRFELVEECEHEKGGLVSISNYEPLKWQCKKCEEWLTIQEWEELECKREYVTCSVALDKLMSGEWKKIALDEDAWIDFHRYIHLDRGGWIANGKLTLDALHRDYFNIPKWYRVE